MPGPFTTDLSLADLENLIEETRKKIATLEGEKAPHLSALEEIDAQIAALRGGVKPSRGKGKGGGAPRVKGRRGKPLKDVIVEVLAVSPEPIGPKAISIAVQKAGYKTKSENFQTIINNTLAKEPRVIKKGKGQYTVSPALKRAAAKAKS